MLASRGLLWIGTNVGCSLTLPLPRLEGVPQIRGRPNVSTHAHIGPVKFLSAIINCQPSVSQRLPGRPSVSSSQSRGSTDHLDIKTEVEVKAKQDDAAVVLLKGVTQSESEFTASGKFQSNSYDDATSHSVHNGRIKSEHYLTSPCTDRDSGLSSQQLWLSTSTPDLRDFENSHEETPQDLYQNLLKEPDNGVIIDVDPYTTANHKRKSKEMMERVSKRISSTSGKVMREIEAGWKHRGSSVASYTTMPRSPSFEKGQGPPIMRKRDSPESTNNNNTPEVHKGVAMRKSPARGTSPGEARTGKDSGICSPEEESRPKSSAVISPLPASVAVQSYAASARSVTIVSGGEGHINWSEALAGDSKYDDLCLLLWQCRTK